MTFNIKTLIIFLMLILASGCSDIPECSDIYVPEEKDFSKNISASEISDAEIPASLLFEKTETNIERNRANQMLSYIERELGTQIYNVSFYYEDLTSGDYISYDGDRTFSGASTIKAPYIKYLLSQNIDMDEQIILKESDIVSYADKTAKSKPGTAFSVKQLMESTICDSDNTSYKMLGMRFGYDGFNKYASEMGIPSYLNTSVNYGRMNAKNGGAYFRDIYEYCETAENGKLLREWLTGCSYEELISKALPQYDVANKYGLMSDDSNVCFHDCAIVYSDKPYVLIIMTELDYNDANTIPAFHKIAYAADELNFMQ